MRRIRAEATARQNTAEKMLIEKAERMNAGETPTEARTETIRTEMRRVAAARQDAMSEEAEATAEDADKAQKGNKI